ncbi:MAG: coxM5 [Frankiales bacterium]|jgi:carbon-monoxide dehydrogenase medium subunit|nr:coxM5 [Frankiales bacterium]
MKPPRFAYYDPDTVAEAVELKARFETDAVVLAGGQSLVPMLATRLAKPDALLDINRISSLQQLEVGPTHVEFGALVRQYQLETDPLVARNVPLLAAVTHYIGHVENRHRGTVGGSLAHADSAAELPTAAVTLDAEMVIEGPAGRRVEAARDFFAGWMTSTIAPDELLVAVRFPITPADAGWGFVEVARREGDFALAAAAAQLRLDEAGRVSEIAIGLASISDRPLRATEVEAQLLGQLPTADAVAVAARAIEEQVTASDDMHATHSYRRHLAATVTQRAVLEAVGRAQEGNRS